MDINDFKANICIIEIENSSYCNRKCSYCINYHIDRFSKNDIMPINLFEKIVDELSSIKYDRMITFHRYNEPFFDKNTMIIERIAYARKKLPYANLVTSSNSDYIDAEYVKKIRKAGLNALYCQCQTEEYNKKSIDTIKENILSINKRIGNFKGKFVLTGNSCVFTAIGSGFRSLTIQARDFVNTGFDRGGIVKNVKTKRISGICYQPLISFTIDFNGKVTMCSNTISYYQAHKDYVIGDCLNQSIFEIYANKKAVELRTQLLSAQRLVICENCYCDYEKYAKQYKLL